MKASDERYTPPEVLQPLIRLFGEMYDPCPRQWVIDGLSKENVWAPRKCFVNPPYSGILAWSERAIYEARTGAFVAFLIPNDCSTKAFRMLAKAAWGRWEIPFRVKFDTPDGRRVDVARSHVVFFLGGLR